MISYKYLIALPALTLSDCESRSTKSRQKIALLRGINVGGNNRIKMVDLVSALTDVGLVDVRTYIQSGNICFESSASCSNLEKLVVNAISDRFGIQVPALVREQKYFEQLIAQSPFCKAGKPNFEISQLHVTLLSKKPKPKAVSEFAKLEFGDEYEIVGDAVYLRLLTGYSKTKLTNGFLEKKLGVAATSRNWKTVCKLVEM